MKDLRSSIHQTTPFGTTVLKPITTNNQIRAHALALQNIQNVQDQLLIVNPFQNNQSFYSTDYRKNYVRGS